MNKKDLILFFDNGTSAHFTILDSKGKLIAFEHVPTTKLESWAKAKAKKTKTGKVSKTTDQGYYTIIDTEQLQKMIIRHVATADRVFVAVENPAVQFMGGWSIKTSLSAFCAYKDVIQVLKKLGLTHTMMSSKEWQDAMIPAARASNNKEYMKTLKAGERNKLLKEAADKLAKELFPNVILKESGDGDSLIGAHYLYLKTKEGIK